jgi:hypothetical protein
MRSPDLLKAMSGSSLKGDCDPILDNLNEADKNKLIHLQKLENQGFDVDQLKQNFLRSKNIDANI